MKENTIYKTRLAFDRMLTGNSYELIFKPNWFQRWFRPLFGLPVDRRRIDPAKVIRKLLDVPTWKNPKHVVGDHAPMIWIASDNQYFPLGAELTSKENGQLVVATAATPREEIVGTVSMCGLETK